MLPSLEKHFSLRRRPQSTQRTQSGCQGLSRTVSTYLSRMGLSQWLQTINMLVQCCRSRCEHDVLLCVVCCQLQCQLTSHCCLSCLSWRLVVPPPAARPPGRRRSLQVTRHTVSPPACCSLDTAGSLTPPSPPHCSGSPSSLWPSKYFGY